VVALHEGDDTPPEPCARESCADRAVIDQQVDQQVELGDRDPVVVAQARVAGEEQRAQGVDVLGVERRDEVEDALVLGDDVAGDRIVGDLVEGGVAQRRDAEAPRDGFARGPALGVAALPANVRSTPECTTRTA
jgi:hypothetical protein